MKQFFIAIGCVCACAAASPVTAQQPNLRPGQLQGFVTLTGRVTGSTGAGVFAIAAPQGRITVLTSGATIRHRNQLVAATMVRPGALVRVSGTLIGSRLTAQTVDILSLPGVDRPTTPSQTRRTRVAPGRRVPPGTSTRTRTQTKIVRPGTRQTTPPTRTTPRS